EVTRTLKPRYELAFRDDALSNEFELPAGEANLVVHSSKAYWDSGYEGPVSKNASAFNPVAVGAALGGMIGALIAHTITGAGERAQGFTFGKSGVIGFEWDD
ncbi:MAG TPA: hypothetical protein VK996_00685, partial [Ramlibacter sp.]|nr:hypothetical protein [Ramlibacter sp.]